MRRVLCWAILLFVLFCVNALCFGQEVVIKAVTAFPKGHLNTDPVPIFVSKVNEALKGKVRIDWVGGPEVIPSFDQPMALKTGRIDAILYTSFMYLEQLVPEALAKGLTELHPWEERASGAYQLWCEIFEKRLNAAYLGSLQSQIPFMLYVNKKISKVEDLKGLKIRVAPLYTPFMKAVGASPVTLPPTEIYTAMERKVVDGFMWPRLGMASWGLHEVTKYMLLPPVITGTENGCFINLNKWKQLPPEAQKVISEIAEDMEWIGAMRSVLLVDKEDKVRLKAGMQFIELPPQEAQKLRKIAYEETWKHVLSKAPEYGERLRKLSSKTALKPGTFPWQD